MQTTTLYVKEATTETAIENLENILLAADGIERAIIDVSDGEIKIDYTLGKIDEMQIIALIEEYGLHVRTE